MSYRPNMDDHEGRLNQEIAQLRLDIRRIGPTYPDQPKVLFGELFDDEQVEQYYEALVGTLKSAKKRQIITFKGQILFKGMHDKVVISIVDESPPPPKKIGENGEAEESPKSKDAAAGEGVKPISPRSLRVATRSRRRTLAVPPSFEKKNMGDNRSPQAAEVPAASGEVAKPTAAKTPPPTRSKPVRRWGSTRTMRSASRSTAPAPTPAPAPEPAPAPAPAPAVAAVGGGGGEGGGTVAKKKPSAAAKKKPTGAAAKKPVVSGVPPPSIQMRRSFEDSEEDKSVSTAATAPAVPPSFEKKNMGDNRSPQAAEVPAASGEVAKPTAAKTPPPTRSKPVRRWGSTRTMRSASRSTAPAPTPAPAPEPAPAPAPAPAVAAVGGGGGEGGGTVAKKKPSAAAKKKPTGAAAKKPVVSGVPPPSIQMRRSFEDSEEDKSVSTAATAPAQLQPPVFVHRARPPPIRKTSSMLSEAANVRVTEEIARLPRDILRITPEGEPWCLFGDLFDDDDVQQHYEALVGTLKSAKKRGVVTFKGQMLLKGMHDRVKVEVIQKRAGKKKGSASVGSKAEASLPSEKKKEEKAASMGVVSGEVTQEV
mmetsp:Transcript_3528/g.9231  ORF Transcript_3528/g.9231 Transcript_3528/m.9231 type:complete len:592 (-) Transcript_3528:80-1855(-)